MSIRYRSRIFRKPFHWSEERYEKHLKKNNIFKNREELNDALGKQSEGDENAKNNC